MNWDTVFQLTLAIVGAALIVGGIIAYRGSTRTRTRAFSSSAIAAGVVMWVVVLITVPVSVTGGPMDPIIEGVEAQYVSETDIEPNYPAIALGELNDTPCEVGSEAVYVTSDGETGCLDGTDVEYGGGSTGTVTPGKPPTIEPAQ